jgi:hypothetical protein
MKKSNVLLSSRRLCVAAVLAGGCLAGNAWAQQQMRRIPEAAPAAPPPPANTVARVAPAAPPASPPPPANTVARVAPAAPPASPPRAASASARVVSAGAAPSPLPKGGAPGHARLAALAPTMNKGGLAPNRMYVPFPQNLAHTVDPKVCTQHGGFGAGLGCTAGLPNGMLALVWDCPNCNVDGYRLFRVDGVKHDPVFIPANGGAFTAALLDAPAGGFRDQCYAAVAYRGTYESVMSNAYCANGGSVINTTTFVPDHVRTSNAYTSSAAPDIAVYSESDLWVGGLHNAGKMAVKDYWTNWIDRLGLHFDLAPLSQKHIFSAKLHLTVDTTLLDSGGVDHGTSCASLIAFGQDRWWTQTDWILAAGQQSEGSFDTPARLNPGSMGGPDSTYDVTPIVVDWARGAQPNFGFVLMTDDKGISGFSNNGCLTNYTSDIKLEVQSY